VEIVRRRSAYDADPLAYADAWADADAGVAAVLAAARRRLAAVPDAVLSAASELCVAAGAESLRADLALGRAAAAHAAWHGRAQATVDDLRAVADLVLTHRQRRHPLDPASGGDAVGEALDDVLGPPSPPEPSRSDASSPSSDAPSLPGGDGPDDVMPAPPEGGTTAEPARLDEPGAPRAVIALVAPRAPQPAGAGRRSPTETTRGRTVGDRAPEPGALRSVAVLPTLRAATTRRATATAPSGPSPLSVEAADLREPIRQARSGNLLVVAVDASGSMGADQRMAEVKGALLGLLVDAYQRRDRVALVTFGGDGAAVVLRPTGSIEVARRRLAELRTGGDTPLAEGIRVAAELATGAATPVLRPLLVVVTDGRATAGHQPWADAVAAGEAVRRRALPSVVIDVETGPSALGLAADLAQVMGARHLLLPVFTGERLQHALAAVTPPADRPR
jgi:magnesium chelatase subunit D